MALKFASGERACMVAGRLVPCGMIHTPVIPDGATQHPTREPHLDAVRCLLMLLGLPFHAAYPFHAKYTWLVVSASKSQTLTTMISFLHLFRMQGFFMLAGYLAALTISKRPATPWISSRMARLLPPFVTALVLLVPIMNLFAAYAAYGQDGPMAAWIEAIRQIGRQTTGHLWFVLVLIYFNIALAVLCWIAPGARTFHISMSDRTARPLLLPLLLACSVGISIWQRGSLAAVHQLPSVAIHPGALAYAVEYAPYFGLGLLLQRCRPLYHRFNRLSWPIVTIGLAAAVFCLTRNQHVPRLVEYAINAVAALGIVHVIVAAAARVFDADRKWVNEIVRASFVIYLFHMPIIVGAFLLVDQLAVSVWVRFALLLTAAASGSTLAWLGIRRVPALLFAFSGEKPSSKRWPPAMRV